MVETRRAASHPRAETEHAHLACTERLNRRRRRSTLRLFFNAHQACGESFLFQRAANPAAIRILMISANRNQYSPHLIASDKE